MWGYVPRVVNVGLAELSLESGDHICALYSGAEEREALLAPYVHAGIAANDKCVCIVEAADQPALLAGVAGPGDVDVDDCIATGQLELFTAAESYLRSGSFSVDHMVAFWTDSLEAALDGGGFEVACNAGDTVGVSHVVAESFDDFAVYEAEVNRLVERYPQTMLCLYDVSHVGGGVLLELLRTHPKLLLAGLVMDNPHYLAPDEYVATRRVRAWAGLTDGERRVAELAAHGLTAAKVAARQSLSRHDADRTLHSVFRKLGLANRDELKRFVAERGPAQ